MNLLLDTNILFYLSRDNSSEITAKTINPNNQTLYLSIVSIAEIKSIALQNNWGIQKQSVLYNALDKLSVLNK